MKRTFEPIPLTRHPPKGDSIQNSVLAEADSLGSNSQCGKM